MKKRSLSLLLALALVLSLPFAPLPVSAEAQGGITEASATTCGCGCGKLFSQVKWQPWEGEMSSGHFYLTGNFVQPEQISVISGEYMVLDLRGYSITTAGKSRLFAVNGYLGILDTVGGGRVTALCATGSSSNGGIITVSDNETPNSTVELFSGTITPADGASTPRSGGIIYIGDGATFRMHGGMLLGGKSASGYNGGAICANQSSSTVDIRGGKIIGAQSGQHGAAIYGYGATVSIKNCYIEGGYASKSGGNIYQYKGSLTIENAVIANGRAATTDNYGGGNINVIGGAAVTVKDSRIYGGWAKSNGGNLSLGYSTVTMTNCQVYGGVCEGQGSNIALPILSANVTLDSCTVDGGMDNMKGKLTLKGVTKIGLKNNGLDMTAQDAGKAFTVSGLQEGSEIYISGVKAFTGNSTYFKPALRTKLTVSGNTITPSVAADGETAGYCPHCNTLVAWQPYGTEGATHTYLTADMADFAEVTVASTLVIDTAGYDITAPGRAFQVEAGGDLAIIDTAGGSIITGSGVNGETGGIVQSAGTLKLYGGKYVFAKATDVLPTGGGIVDNSGAAYIYDVVMDAQKFVNNTSGVQGGAIRCADGKTVTLEMQGGRILGGTAYNGGALSVGTNNTTRITSVSFASGIASNGGNVSTRGSASEAAGKLYLTGCAFYSGEATSEYAGNLYFSRQSGSITDCYFTAGEAKKYGGNMAVGLSTNITITNSVFRNGTSSQYGGNFYVPGTSSKFTLDGCLVTNGTATSGGNIYVNNGYMTVKGGEISYGETTSGSGGNIVTQTPNNTSLLKDDEGNVPLICGGIAAGSGGNIYAANVLNIGAAQFGNGTAAKGKDLYIGSKSSVVPTLTLGADIRGAVYVGVIADLLTEEVYGGTVQGVTCNAENAELYLDTHGNCGLFTKDSKLYVAKAAVMNADGSSTWYSSSEAAVDACGSGSYVKLYGDSQIALTKDLYADLNGNAVTVTGNYTLYGMDSSGDAFTDPTGKATVTEAAVEAAVYAPNGSTYIADTTDGVTTYHRLDMQVTGVNIRPSADGVYYTAKWSCDDTLKNKIGSYGIAASIVDMPTAEFSTDEDTLWTAMTKDTFVSGAKQNGAVIAGILKADGRTAEENSENGKKNIYAKAYMKFTDGTTLISGDNVRFSLHSLMTNLDRLIVEKPIQYRKYNLSARNFYEKWKDNGMGDWQLSKIPKPADDGVIDLLMVGNSFCYYYVEELYNMAKAAGYSIRVCNLYYSGCPLEKHYNWWINGKSNYQLFEISDDTGGVKVSQNNVSLESALAKYEWDYIALQARTSGLLDSGAQSMVDSNKLYWESLLDYFIAQFPNARIAWHQSWANQANEYGREDSDLTPENQTKWADLIDEYGILVTDYYNEPAGKTVVQRINTGRAWQFCREDGYDYLCARLGKTNNGMANAGDGYHDGDIGGAQYLNAAVWFEFIFGQSCVGNTYRPNYKTSQTLDPTLLAKLRVEKTETGYALTEEFVQQLQSYAHRAVELAKTTTTE